MSKLDKVLEITAPVAKETAKETAKLAGKGMKLAGKGIKEAGEKAVTNYKEKKEDQIETRFEELKEQYPGGIVFRAFDATSSFDGRKLSKLGLEKYAKADKLMNIPKLSMVIVNQNNEVQYRLYGDFDAQVKRYFVVYGQGTNRIGSVNEHQKILSLQEGAYETIRVGSKILGDLHDNYSFTNPNILVENAGTITHTHFVVSNPLCTMMEIEAVRGHVFIAIADPHFLNECIMIFTAIELIRKPNYAYRSYGG